MKINTKFASTNYTNLGIYIFNVMKNAANFTIAEYIWHRSHSSQDLCVRYKQKMGTREYIWDYQDNYQAMRFKMEWLR